MSKQTLKDQGKPGLPAILYQKPNARKSIVHISEIYTDDADYIMGNEIQVSLEEISDGSGGSVVVMYFNDGLMIDDEPDELMILDGGRPCAICMEEAVIELKKRKEYMNRNSSSNPSE